MLHTVELGSRARLSAHTVRDHLANPACTLPADVPWDAQAIAPQWLTTILCAGVVDAAVVAVHVEAASAGSSVRKRIAVSYNEAGQRAGLTTSFFAKTTPTILTRLTSGPSAGQEAKFFAQLKPDVPIETPVHRYSAHDRISGRSIHLFEDLVATRGASFCDYRTVFARPQIDAAIDLMATLHGRFCNDSRLQSDFAWIPTYEVFFHALARTGTRVGHDEAMLKARHLVPADVFQARDKLWSAAEDGLAIHAAGARVIIHSDVHPGNWYVTAAGALGLCDWQCIAQGHWARDFAYAVSTMLDVPARRAWERELLMRYLARLQQAGGPSVVVEDAWQHYRRQLPAALLMWTPTLCHPPTMPDMQPEAVSFEMIRRITTAIDDLGVLQ